jgi:hypothetical protein
LHELVSTGDGIAILEQGLALGGGNLQHFGLNSNTSANGFIKCLYKRKEITMPGQTNNAQNNSAPRVNNQSSAAMAQMQRRINMLPEGSPERKKLKDMLKCGLDEGGESDSDDCEEGGVSGGGGNNGAAVGPKRYEYLALNPFKDLYKHSPIIRMSFEFGPSCIPLSAVGMIMNFAGNHLLHYIH